MSGERVPERHTAGVIAVGPDGRILLLLRDDRPEIGAPNHWSTLGGHVEAGETPEQAAWREVVEEVGVRPPEMIPAGYVDGPSLRQPSVWLRQHIFATRVPWTLEELILAEGQCVNWFAPAEVPPLQMAGPIKSAVAGFLDSPLYRQLAEERNTAPVPEREPLPPELPGRLGIRPGSLVSLRGATAGFVLRLRQAAKGARLTTSPGALERPDVTLWWPRAGIDATALSELRAQMADGGVLWVVLSTAGAPLLLGAEELRRLCRDLGLVQDATVAVTGTHQEIGFRVLNRLP